MDSGNCGAATQWPLHQVGHHPRNFTLKGRVRSVELTNKKVRVPVMKLEEVLCCSHVRGERDVESGVVEIACRVSGTRRERVCVPDKRVCARKREASEREGGGRKKERNTMQEERSERQVPYIGPIR